MKMNEEWYDLYQKFYGTNFNRNLTIGTKKNGYRNHNVRKLDQLIELVEEAYPQKEIYITMYDFKTDENILKWDRFDQENYEKYAVKDAILLRFRENTKIAQQETQGLNEVQTYMFIRRSINLGQDNKMLNEVKKVYETLENLFNVKAIPVYNGYNEYGLYVFLDEELHLENPSTTLYYLYKFIEDYCDTETLRYEKIEPFSQIITLPGTQNNNSRLYSKIFDINDAYLDVIDNASRKEMLKEYEIPQKQKSPALISLLKTVDQEITKRADDHTDVRSFSLNELFHEDRLN